LAARTIRASLSRTSIAVVALAVALAMTIGVAETTFMSYKIDSDTFHGLEATTGAMFVYLVLGMAVVKTMSYFENKFRIHGLVGR